MIDLKFYDNLSTEPEAADLTETTTSMGQIIAQNVLARLLTPRGSVPHQESYGTDLLQLMQGDGLDTKAPNLFSVACRQVIDGWNSDTALVLPRLSRIELDAFSVLTGDYGIEYGYQFCATIYAESGDSYPLCFTLLPTLNLDSKQWVGKTSTLII